MTSLCCRTIRHSLQRVFVYPTLNIHLYGRPSKGGSVTCCNNMGDDDLLAIGREFPVDARVLKEGEGRWRHLERIHMCVILQNQLKPEIQLFLPCIRHRLNPMMKGDDQLNTEA
jgi:hypothetical protein